MPDTISIGAVSLPKTAALAPMAGVADRAFREVCRSFGACYLVGEMASSKGLTYGSRKTGELLEISDSEHPMAIQLFGCEPSVMADAARLALRYRPDILDINMGCPAPKVAGNGGGSALMRDPVLAGRIVRAVVEVSDVPVTVKIRKGWDEDSVNAVEVALRCEDGGAAAVAVHGRTRAQMYAPPVDLDIIRSVKEAVSVPVIGNGDIDSPLAAAEMYAQTGCDLVMVGRGALGHPWLFRQIERYLADGTILPEPPLSEKMEIMRAHIELLCRYKGERVGMREARGHVAWYIKGFRGAAAYRRAAGQLTDLPSLDRLIRAILGGEPAQS